MSHRIVAVLAALFVGMGCARSPGGRPPAGFQPLFNGRDLSGWTVLDGKLDQWGAEQGILFVKGGGGGWLMTEDVYADFELRLDYHLPHSGNSGVALRAPLKGDPAYEGMEIQLIDDVNWKDLRPAQHTGSIYDVVPPLRQPARPGEWNQMRIVARGRRVVVEVNGALVVDADLDQFKDLKDKHPGLLRDSGHLGLQSHDGRFDFRNLYIKPF